MKISALFGESKKSFHRPTVVRNRVPKYRSPKKQQFEKFLFPAGTSAQFDSF